MVQSPLYRYIGQISLNEPFRVVQRVSDSGVVLPRLKLSAFSLLIHFSHLPVFYSPFSP